jgi:hypothetical protein
MPSHVFLDATMMLPGRFCLLPDLIKVTGYYDAAKSLFFVHFVTSVP